MELMIVLVIGGILATGAIAAYGMFVDRAKVARAVGDIGEIHTEIQKFLLSENGGFPANLAEIGLAGLTGPWGNPYQYLVL